MQFVCTGLVNSPAKMVSALRESSMPRLRTSEWTSSHSSLETVFAAHNYVARVEYMPSSAPEMTVFVKHEVALLVIAFLVVAFWWPSRPAASHLTWSCRPAQLKTEFGHVCRAITCSIPEAYARAQFSVLITFTSKGNRLLCHRNPTR
jgi:hypothetical protein